LHFWGRLARFKDREAGCGDAMTGVPQPAETSPPKRVVATIPVVPDLLERAPAPPHRERSG
jgi:hypothetical protein